MTRSLVLEETNIVYAATVTDYTEEELRQILAAYKKHKFNIVRIPVGKGWRKKYGNLNQGPDAFHVDLSID